MNVTAVTSWDTDCGIAWTFIAARIRGTERGCWEWTGVVCKITGYPLLSHKGKTYRVHSLVYKGVGRSIPPGLVPDHTCRVRHCINPDHLEPVTQRVNTLRGISIVAQNAAKTHCKRGHLLAGVNLRVKAGRYGPIRVCRTCQRAEGLRRYYRNKEAA